MMKTSYFTLMLLATIFYACSGTENEKARDSRDAASMKKTQNTVLPEQNFPENGEFYFSAMDSTMEKYITLHIRNRRVEGRLYVKLYEGAWYHDFSGRFVNDTTLQLTVSYKETTNDETWHVQERDKTLYVSNIYQEQKTVRFAFTSPQSMPDTVNYIQVETYDVSEE